METAQRGHAFPRSARICQAKAEKVRAPQLSGRAEVTPPQKNPWKLRLPEAADTGHPSTRHPNGRRRAGRAERVCGSANSAAHNLAEQIREPTAPNQRTPLRGGLAAGRRRRAVTDRPRQPNGHTTRTPPRGAWPGRGGHGQVRPAGGMRPPRPNGSAEHDTNPRAGTAARTWPELDSCGSTNPAGIRRGRQPDSPGREPRCVGPGRVIALPIPGARPWRAPTAPPPEGVAKIDMAPEPDTPGRDPAQAARLHPRRGPAGMARADARNAAGRTRPRRTPLPAQGPEGTGPGPRSALGGITRGQGRRS